MAHLALEVKLYSHSCTQFYFLLGTLSKTEWYSTFFLFQGTIQPEVPATIPALPKNVVKESVAKNDIPTGKVLQNKMSKIYVKIVVAAHYLKENHNFHMQYIHRYVNWSKNY